MSRKTLILLVLIPSLKSLHHLLDSMLPYEIRPFLFNDIALDVQWYIKDITDLISLSILYYICWLNVKGKLLKSASIYLFIFSITDIFGYLFLYLQYNLLIQTVCLLALGSYWLFTYNENE